jgi:GntR family transcriptional repressor for pyruvate dehydrogenase complex
MSSFKPIKQNRVSGSVTEQLKKAIILNEFKPGDKLPAERELAAQFSVSRLSIREALRPLENSGFIRVRQGVGGGVFVTEPNFEHLVDSFLDLFMTNKITIPVLHQLRILVEVEGARLAALNVTPEYAKRLQEALALEELPMRSHADHLARKTPVHHIVAEMSGNVLFEVIVRFAMSAIAQVLEFVQPDAEAMHPVGIHRPIVDAVLAGDPKAAMAAMKEHGIRFGQELMKIESIFRGG